MAKNENLTITISANSAGAVAALKQVSTSVDNLSKNAKIDTLSGKFDGLISKAKLAAGAIGVAGAAIGTNLLKKAVQTSQEFADSISELGYAAGASEKDLAALREQAKNLGADIQLPGATASGAAEAMTELAKAGLNATETIAASKGTMALAISGQIDFADAAVITTGALHAFGLEAGQAGHVADVLAAGANKSNADISALGLGLQNVGSAASSFNIPLEDTVAALGLMTNNGIDAANAGTSLKSALTQIATPTKTARGIMEKYNIDLFDAQGNFVGLSETSEILQKSLGGLSDEARNNALSTVFGSYGMNSMITLMKSGSAGFDEMTKAVNVNGEAVNAAASKTSSFSQIVENMKGELENTAISVGDELLPVVGEMAEGFTNFVKENGPKVAQFFKEFVGEASELVKKVWPDLRDGAESVFSVASTVGKTFWDIGKTILPPVASAFKVVAGVLETLKPLIPAVVAGFVGFKAISGISSLASGAANSFGLFAKNISTAAITAGNGTGALGKVAAAADTVGTKAMGASGVMQKFGNFMGGPWGLLIGAGVSALISLVTELYNSQKAAEEGEKKLAEYKSATHQAEITTNIYADAQKRVKENLNSTGESMKSLSSLTDELSQKNSAADQNLNSLKATAAGLGYVLDENNVLTKDGVAISDQQARAIPELGNLYQKYKDSAVAASDAQKELDETQKQMDENAFQEKIFAYNSGLDTLRATAGYTANDYANFLHSMENENNTWKQSNGNTYIATAEQMDSYNEQIKNKITSTQGYLSESWKTAESAGVIKASDSAQAQVNAYIKFIDANKDNFTEKGKLVGENTFKPTADSAGKFGNDSANAFSASIDNKKSLFKATGQNAASGFNEGFSGIAAAAAKTAEGVVNAMKQKLQIHSPSRVFRYLGDMTAQGFAAGIDDNEENVNASLENMAKMPYVSAPSAITARAGYNAGNFATNNTSSTNYYQTFNFTLPANSTAENAGYNVKKLVQDIKREFVSQGLAPDLKNAGALR